MARQMRRWRRVARRKTEQARGGESDKDQDREREAACLSGQLRKKKKRCPRRFILLGKKSLLEEVV